MKICDSCGKVGGKHTSFCSYKNKDPEMLDVHPSHNMLTDKCSKCNRSDVAGLVLECAADKKAEIIPAKPTFPIDSSHETELDDGVWRCKFCRGVDVGTLKNPCKAEIRPRRVSSKKFIPPKGTILLDDMVWMIYSWPDGPAIHSIHKSAEDAVKANVDNYSIGQWKLGVDFREAVKQWESRNEKNES